MRLIDYKMNYYGEMILAGGVGGVAVDLLHKKKGLAKDLITYYLDYYEQKGAALAFLYPFRPDFYYKMGFGYGTKMNQYSFCPASLPSAVFSGELVYLTGEDLPLIRRFYEKLTRIKHGYCFKSEWEYEGLIKHSATPHMMIGYKEADELKGYVTFGFRKGHENNFVKNNMHIREWLWETPEALNGLCHFLQTQADQINRIIFNTQDADFHWLLKDVRNPTDNIIPSVYHESNTAGVGVMYRIISIPKFIAVNAKRDFNRVNLNLAITVEDTLRPQNQGVYHVAIVNGCMTTASETPLKNVIELKLNIADLSALFLGSVDIKTLFRLGKLNLTAHDMDLVHQAFRVEAKPECISAF
jgi:predicted acetyltransferase